MSPGKNLTEAVNELWKVLFNVQSSVPSRKLKTSVQSKVMDSIVVFKDRHLEDSLSVPSAWVSLFRAAYAFWVTWSERRSPFASDTSPKWIDRETPYRVDYAKLKSETIISDR